MGKKKLDIILPCYNPNKNWENRIIIFLKEIIYVLKEYDWQLIIVNDGSTNNYININSFKNSNFPIKVIHSSINQGKGAALRMGVTYSSAKSIVYTDIDIPYTNDSFINVIKELDNEDIVFTKREQSYYQEVPFFRKLISKLLKKIIKVVLGFNFTDTQAGLKGFNSGAKKHFLNTKSNGYLFDLEFVISSMKDKSLSFSITEVKLNNDVVFSKMSFKILLREFKSLINIILK